MNRNRSTSHGSPVGAAVGRLAAKQLRSDFMRESMITLAERRELSIADYGIEDEAGEKAR